MTDTPEPGPPPRFNLDDYPDLAAAIDGIAAKVADAVGATGHIDLGAGITSVVGPTGHIELSLPSLQGGIDAVAEEIRNVVILAPTATARFPRTRPLSPLPELATIAVIYDLIRDAVDKLIDVGVLRAAEHEIGLLCLIAAVLLANEARKKR